MSTKYTKASSNVMRQIAMEYIKSRFPHVLNDINFLVESVGAYIDRIYFDMEYHNKISAKNKPIAKIEISTFLSLEN